MNNAETANEIVRRELEAYYVSPRDGAAPFDIRAAITAALDAKDRETTTPDMFWPDDHDEGEGAHDDLELIADRCDDGQLFVVQQAKQLPAGYYVAQTKDGMTDWRDATEEEIAAYKKGEADRLARWKEKAKVLPNAFASPSTPKGAERGE